MARKRLILVVDDEPAARQTATLTLQLEGYDVEALADGGKALSRLLADPKPTLILLDIMMPVVDGITVLRWIKAHPATLAIPVIMLSAKTDALATRTATIHGAANFITKPFGTDELLAAVDAAIIAAA